MRNHCSGKDPGRCSRFEKKERSLIPYPWNWRAHFPGKGGEHSWKNPAFTDADVTNK
jgi:hypothetical protein